MNSRTLHPSRAGGLLLAAAVLAAAGGFLLWGPGGHEQAADRQAAARHAGPSPATSTPAASAPPRASHDRGPSPAPRSLAPHSTASGPSKQGSALPVAGEGPQADGAIQQALEKAWPADLPKADAHRAVARAWKIWRADVTGANAQTHHRYTQARKQAAIARRADGGRVQVHLVWAGAGPDGKQREGRTVRILLDPRHPDEWTVMGS